MRDNNGQLIRSTSPGSLNTYSRLHTRPPTIYKFICASSHANAAFTIDSPQILDAAIERSIPEFKHSARMIAILGTLASKPDLSFNGLIDRYKDLPANILSTASASRAFVKEVLQYICFISLLQNIHEVIWSVTPDDGQETIHYYIKQSRIGIQFQAAAWWAPSWVEKMRILRAYWNLFIYWNIQAISPDLTAVTDDWKFNIYRTAIKSIDPRIGPYYDNKNDPEAYSFYVPHEIEEMKCVLVATRDFLGFPLESSSSFSPFTARHCQSPRLQLEKWTSSSTFKESLHWILEQPESVGAGYLYQDKASINKMNYHLRTLYWRSWDRDCSEQAGDQLLPPDYLGLCIWDGEPLGYLGLKLMSENYVDPCWGPVRSPSNSVYTSTRMTSRWRNVFLQVLLKLPGGKLRPQSKNLGDLNIKWYGASSSIRTRR